MTPLNSTHNYPSWSEKRPTWFRRWWRRHRVCTPSEAPSTCSPARPTRTRCSSARWSTACRGTRSSRRSLTLSTSTSTVSVPNGRPPLKMSVLNAALLLLLFSLSYQRLACYRTNCYCYLTPHWECRWATPHQSLMENRMVKDGSKIVA